MWDKYNEEDEEIEDVIEESFEILDEKPKKRIRRTKEQKESEDYVSKDEMWNELFNYYVSLGKGYDWENQKIIDRTLFPDISDKLTSIINDIATKMGYRSNFCGYSWIDEMVGDSVLKMAKAIRDCSFKCYTIAEILSETNENGQEFISYIDKKEQAQKKPKEDSDTFFEENGKKYIKFKANPFGYFSRITSHSYLNRIKKEKLAEDTKRNFQTETWEKLYASETFRNVRRPKFIEGDESDVIFEE
jgi:hypothetical protein